MMKTLSALLFGMALNPFRPFGDSPTYQEEYRGNNYTPTFINTEYGRQIIAPDTPYVAAAGKNLLYFIDTRLDAKTAGHIKQQLERAFVPNMEEIISINEFTATAETVNAETRETTFTFDPVYARVLFAKGINKRNPEIKLVEHKIGGGDWLVAYDLDVTCS
ncbi:uncharacterized protein TrAFT101_004329 [Trichoderma asperellum]|nr:hypothetical protein TrAFT101_004329 [Trichoderma asperellum]